MTKLARLAHDIGKPRDADFATIETPRLVLRPQSSETAGTIGIAILLKPSFAEAGWMEFRLRGDRAADLCFFLAPPYRGRSLMREAVRAAAPPALRLLGARSIRATLPADAPAARAVARSIGLIEASRRGAMTRFEKDLCILF